MKFDRQKPELLLTRISNSRQELTERDRKIQLLIRHDSLLREMGVSRPVELPHQPLLKPYVNLSIHTASVRQTIVLHV